MKYIALVSLLTLCLQSFAQDDFVVTITGDTLYGKVNFPTPKEFSETIMIRDENGSTTLNARKMNLAYVKGEMYKSVVLTNKVRVMKVLVDGYLSLFKFRLDNSFEFSSHYLVKRTGEGVALSSAIGFKKRLSAYLSDCESLAQDIKNKKYSVRDLKEITERYNSECLEVRNDNISSIDGLELKAFNKVLSDVLNALQNGEEIPESLQQRLKEYSSMDLNEELSKLLNLVDKK